MKTNEYYRPIGEIEIEDTKTGNIIVKAHNMIVIDGRLLIINAVVGGKSIDKSKFKMFYENNHDVITTPEMDYSKDIKNYDTVIDEKNTNNGGAFKTVTVNNKTKEFVVSDSVIDQNNICIKSDFAIRTQVDYTKITSIGFSYGEKENAILFSRASINPVYLRSDRLYVVHYTLYF